MGGAGPEAAALGSRHPAATGGHVGRASSSLELKGTAVDQGPCGREGAAQEKVRL